MGKIYESIDEKLAAWIGRQSMLELIEDLSEEQQQVLTLKFVFNFPNSDVATILGKTEGNREAIRTVYVRKEKGGWKVQDFTGAIKKEVKPVRTRAGKR